MHGFCLADAMAPILRLLIHARIPVSIIENDAISARQVDANTTTAGRGDKAENLGI